MIKDIEIKNFRCFSILKASGFAKVNLISGKNNAGKTALLEALFLNSSPISDSILFLRQLRRETVSFSKAIPERTWNGFFFNQDKSKPLIISVNLDHFSRSLEISIEESINKFIENFNSEAVDQSDRDKFISFLSGSESFKSVISLQTMERGQTFKTSIMSTSNGLITQEILSIPKSQSNDIHTKVVQLPDVKNTFFVSSSLRLANSDLTREFDKARFNNKEIEVLKAFQIIDSSITEVSSFNIGEPTIYLKKEKELERLPLALFGDAINRIAEIILRLVNNENSILLIDEIENGIHYTNHESFWDILFRLTEALKVQIFCTTHSLEMMQAFVKAGKNYENSGAHFELAKQAKSGNIVAIRRDLETLGYGIEHHKGVRGE
jgi:AAA15 family ATPase/GTPase